jgi:peptidylprolyl isomerase
VATEKRQRQDQRRVEKLKEQEVLTTKQAAVKKRKRFLWFLIPGVLLVAGVLFWPKGSTDDTVATDTGVTGGTTTVPGVTTTTLLPAIAKKPDVIVGTGAAPSKLETKDLVVGTGPEVVKGADVKINKVAKVWETKKEVDSTWGTTPNLYEVKGVGNGVIMAGLDEGLIGMKQGGRRQITIPASKAFGTKGSTSLGVKPGESLVYVIDAVEVIPPTK